MNIDSLPNIDAYLRSNYISASIIGALLLGVLIFWLNKRHEAKLLAEKLNEEPGRSHREAYGLATKFYEAGRLSFDNLLKEANTTNKYRLAMSEIQKIVFFGAMPNLIDPFQRAIDLANAQIVELKEKIIDTQMKLDSAQMTTPKDWVQIDLVTREILDTREKLSVQLEILARMSKEDAKKKDELLVAKKVLMDESVDSNMLGGHLEMVKLICRNLFDTISRLASSYGWLLVTIFVWACDAGLLYMFFDSVMSGETLPFPTPWGSINGIGVISMLLTFLFAVLIEMLLDYLKSFSVNLMRQVLLSGAVIVGVFMLLFAILLVYLTMHNSHVEYLDLVMRVLIIPVTAALAGLMHKMKVAGAGFDIVYAPLLLPFLVVYYILTLFISAIFTSIRRSIAKSRFDAASSEEYESKETKGQRETIRLLSEKDEDLTKHQQILRDHSKAEYDSSVRANREAYESTVANYRTLIENSKLKIEDLLGNISIAEGWLQVLLGGSNEAVLECAGARVATSVPPNDPKSVTVTSVK